MRLELTPSPHHPLNNFRDASTRLVERRQQGRLVWQACDSGEAAKDHGRHGGGIECAFDGEALPLEDGVEELMRLNESVPVAHLDETMLAARREDLLCRQTDEARMVETCAQARGPAR